MNIRTRTSQSGLSIVELMISITIGLIILAGLTTILVNNSRARSEIERANRQIENGRYALQLLSDDLKLAGYAAEFDPSSMGLPSTLPDPCLTTPAALQDALPLHVQGIDNAATIPSCLSDVKSNTDILVIRRASTCEAGGADCAAAVSNGTPYFQASLCFNAAELNSPITNNASYLGHYYQLDTNLASMTLHKRDCTTVAGIHRYRTHIYFIANNNNSGDGIPTLKRAELGPGPAFAIVALVDGIENLQIQYGIDSLDAAPTTVDGVPDGYSAAPASIAEWKNVVSAKINLLARNTEKTAGYSTTKSYTLGYDASNNPITVSFADSYKRHAYQSQVRLNNPAGRSM